MVPRCCLLLVLCWGLRRLIRRHREIYRDDASGFVQADLEAAAKPSRGERTIGCWARGITAAVKPKRASLGLWGGRTWWSTGAPGPFPDLRRVRCYSYLPNLPRRVCLANFRRALGGGTGLGPQRLQVQQTLVAGRAATGQRVAALPRTGAIARSHGCSLTHAGLAVITPCRLQTDGC